MEETKAEEVKIEEVVTETVECTEIENRSTRSKNFNYLKDGVQLAFNLRTDIKNELVIFKELLELAIKEVTEEIES